MQHSITLLIGQIVLTQPGGVLGHCPVEKQMIFRLSANQMERHIAAECCGRLMMLKLGTLVFGKFIPFFSSDPLKLSQVGWGPSLHSYFQVSPDMLDWVQVWALAGPLKDNQRLVRKPLLHCLGCAFRVVVPLEGEPSPQCHEPFTEE